VKHRKVGEKKLETEMLENSNISVLVVDDEPSIRTSLSNFLDDYNFHVFDAESGEAALEKLDTDGADVAIVDYRLPGMNGNTFMHEAHALCPHLRFLVYTGSVRYEIPESSSLMGLGPDHVFLKPLANLTRIRDAILSLMQEK
jgi:DNA-binding NtrC family response regulator